MELVRPVLLASVAALLGASPAWAGTVHSRFASATATAESPVTRSVRLLQELQEKATKEQKKETEQYEKFVCWAKSVVSQKTMSTAEAEAELSSAKQYISDIDSGRVELSTERVDLEKELGDLMTSLETAEAARKQENEDYEEAAEELEQGVTALKSAIEVLSTATEGHEKGVLLGIRTSASHAEAADSQEAAALSRAVQLGDRFLEAGDAVFLRRLLGGEVPKADWKQLNRKATFKMSYKARSFKIQDVLAKLLAVFEGNLAEAQKKESDSQELYDKLYASKTKEKEAAKEALAKMAKEGGAKGETKAEIEARIGMLEEQVENDKKYIEQVSTSLETKKAQYQERTTLRSKEIASISEAIGILSSDDSKDVFKRSLASQGYLFLQTRLAFAGASTRTGQVAQGAASELQAAAAAAHDGRLQLLAERLANPEAIAEVVEAIGKMVTNLKDEQKSDDEKKETCESNRMEDTRAAVLAGRTIDEASDTITKLTSDVGELEGEIKKKEELNATAGEQMAAAQAQRDEEHATFLASQKDDQLAADTVKEAIDVLEKFYKENDLSLVQRKKQKEPVEVTAGEAPPPPPKTWDDAGYKGQVQESGGIIMVLKMIQEDILKDKTKSEKAEESAVALFTETSDALSKEQIELGEQIDEMRISKGEKVETIESTRGERTLKAGELSVLMEKIRDVQPGCDFFQVNYLVRKKSRFIEMDGLLKAKAILEGASFDSEEAGPLEPGNAALLVRARRRLQSLETR